MPLRLVSCLVFFFTTSLAFADPARCDASNGCRATTEAERSIVRAWRNKVTTLVQPVLQNPGAPLSVWTADGNSDASCANFTPGCFPRVEAAWRSSSPASKLSEADVYARALLFPVSVDVCAAALGMKVLSRAEGLVELLREEEGARGTYVLALGEVTCSRLPGDRAAALAARERVVEVPKAGAPARYLAPPIALVVTLVAPTLEIERYRLRVPTIALSAPVMSDKLRQLQLATAHIEDGFVCERSEQCLSAACISGVCGGAAGVTARRERSCRENPDACTAPPKPQGEPPATTRPVQLLGATRANSRGAGCIYDSQCGTGRCSGGVCSSLTGPSYMKSHADFMSDYYRFKY